MIVLKGLEETVDLNDDTVSVLYITEGFSPRAPG